MPENIEIRKNNFWKALKKKNKNNVFLIEKNCAQVYNESKSNAVKTRLL